MGQFIGGAGHAPSPLGGRRGEASLSPAQAPPGGPQPAAQAVPPDLAQELSGPAALDSLPDFSALLLVGATVAEPDVPELGAPSPEADAGPRLDCRLLVSQVESLREECGPQVDAFVGLCRKPLAPGALAGAGQVAVALRALAGLLAEIDRQGGDFADNMKLVVTGVANDLQDLQRHLAGDARLQLEHGLTLEALLERLDGQTSLRRACAGAGAGAGAKYLPVPDLDSASPLAAGAAAAGVAPADPAGAVADAEAQGLALLRLLQSPVQPARDGKATGSSGHAQVLELIGQALPLLAALDGEDGTEWALLQAIAGCLRADASIDIPAGTTLGMLLKAADADGAGDPDQVAVAVKGMCKALAMAGRLEEAANRPLLDSVAGRDGKSGTDDARARATHYLEDLALAAEVAALRIDRVQRAPGLGGPNFLRDAGTTLRPMAAMFNGIAGQLRTGGDATLPAGITPRVLHHYVTHDLPVTARTLPGGLTAARQDGEMTRLGAGSFNTTFTVRYRGVDGGPPFTGVFKPIPREERGFASQLGISQHAPRTAPRNLAASDVGALLGVDVLVRTHLAEGRRPGGVPELGLVMDTARGRTAHALRSANPGLFKRADVHQQMTQLQLADFLIGQVDRGLQNILVEAGADGAVVVKGIDQDQTFGDRIKAPGDVAYQPTHTHWGFRGAMLPPVVDEATAASFLGVTADPLRTTLSPLLSASEVAAAVQRLEAIHTHLQALKDQGLVVPVADLAKPGTQALLTPANSYIARCTQADFQFLMGPPRADSKATRAGGPTLPPPA